MNDIHRLLIAVNEHEAIHWEYFEKLSTELKGSEFDTWGEATLSPYIWMDPMYLIPTDIGHKLHTLSDEILMELFWNGIVYDKCYWRKNEQLERLQTLCKATYDMYCGTFKKICNELEFVGVSDDIVTLIIEVIMDAVLL